MSLEAWEIPGFPRSLDSKGGGTVDVVHVVFGTPDSALRRYLPRGKKLQNGNLLFLDVI